METVPVEQFGKDHWSLLGYVECRCADNHGELDFDHLRINVKNHPVYDRGSRRRPPWGNGYGTRLRGFFTENNPSLRLLEHDDWDCIDDLESAGLIKIEGTGMSPIIVMTKTGNKIAGELRSYKTGGGVFATFVPKHMPEPVPQEPVENPQALEYQ